MDCDVLKLKLLKKNQTKLVSLLLFWHFSTSFPDKRRRIKHRTKIVTYRLP